jgi:hypothetical protein
MSIPQDYTCPRCGYSSHRKSNIRNHFYKKNKLCPATVDFVELTDKVKEYILENKVYRPLNSKYPPLQPNKTPNRKQTISHALRVTCWNTYIGEEVGRTPCLCCKSNFITPFNFQCGHIVAEADGGTINIDNLRPICGICNSSMGTINMCEYALDNFNNVI